MGFQGLLGNEELKENLLSSLRRGHIAHFYLLCGPQGSGKHTLATLLAAAAQCTEPQKPCLHCAACRKILSGTHPDFITIDDPEKKTVSVDLIRDARKDMYIRPNEGARKIYLIPRAQDMRLEAQNALLKVLEEPPAYGMFLLLTDNPEKLLPTVRSRCTELRLRPLPEALLKQRLASEFPEAEPEALAAAVFRSGGYLGQARLLLRESRSELADSFLDCFARGDELGLMKLWASLEKTRREEFGAEMNRWMALAHEALLCRSGMKAVSRQVAQKAKLREAKDWNRAVYELKQAVVYAQGNVSVAAICGYLSWALR